MKRKFVRVLSRHPSADGLREIIDNQGLRIVYRHGSTTVTKIPHYEINDVLGVMNSSNKLVMKQLFEKAEINSAPFCTDINDIDDLPVVAKRSYRSRGIGMKFISNVEELETFKNEFLNQEYNKKNPYYFEKYVNYTREYRYHVSDFGCFHMVRKMLKNGADKRWCRNDQNSVWILPTNKLFVLPECHDEIVEHCQKALKAIDLNIGAFDIRVNKTGTKFSIIEVNSAPSLGNITTELYKKEIEKYVQSFRV